MSLSIGKNGRNRAWKSLCFGPVLLVDGCLWSPQIWIEGREDGDDRACLRSRGKTDVGTYALWGLISRRVYYRGWYWVGIHSAKGDERDAES